VQAAVRTCDMKTTIKERENYCYVKGNHGRREMTEPGKTHLQFHGQKCQQHREFLS